MSPWFINYKQPKHLLQLSVRRAFISSSRDHCNGVTFNCIIWEENCVLYVHWVNTCAGRRHGLAQVCMEETEQSWYCPHKQVSFYRLWTWKGCGTQISRSPRLRLRLCRSCAVWADLLRFHPPCMCKQGLNFCEILTNISIYTVSLLVPALKRECTKERHESLTPPWTLCHSSLLESWDTQYSQNSFGTYCCHHI